LDIWKLRVKRKEAGKGRCIEDDNVVHISLKRNETERWRERFSKNKWLQIMEKIAHKEVNSYNKTVQLKKQEHFSTKYRENQVIKIVQGLDEMREDRLQT
jgi:hypothetical protein